MTASVLETDIVVVVVVNTRFRCTSTGVRTMIIEPTIVFDRILVVDTKVAIVIGRLFNVIK